MYDRKDCFAYSENGGVPHCTALESFNCSSLGINNCPFYKTKDQIEEDNRKRYCWNCSHYGRI